MTVTLEHVTRSVDGIAAIRDVSLMLERGTLNVLLGPTLSGKTSTMRLLAGLDKPTSGRILVDGKDVTGVDVRQRSVAMVYQQFINYPSLSVYENIASPLRVQGKPRSEIEKRVGEAARLLRLEPYLDRKPRAPVPLSSALAAMSRKNSTSLSWSAVARHRFGCLDGWMASAGTLPLIHASKHPKRCRATALQSAPHGGS